VCLFYRLAEAIGFSKRTKSMQTVKETVIDWRTRRLISKLYVDQSVKSVSVSRGDKEM